MSEQSSLHHVSVTVKYFKCDVYLSVVALSYAVMMMRIFLLLLLLWSVIGVNSVNPVYPSTDTEDDVSGSGSDGKDDLPCCSSGNYTFYSIVDVLNNVTSNTIIKISTDVVLSSNVTLKGINSIRIIGQGNSTVNCM